MNLIYNLMGNKGSELIGNLTDAGLSAEQAQGFLPDALQSVMGGLQQVDITTLMGTDSDTQLSSLMDKIDITALAGHLGGDSELASSGLQAIIPQVLGFLKDNPAAASLLGMQGGKGASGLAGMAKGLFH